MKLSYPLLITGYKWKQKYTNSANSCWGSKTLSSTNQQKGGTSSSSSTGAGAVAVAKLPGCAGARHHVTLAMLQFVVLPMHARFGNKQNACGKHFSGVCPLGKAAKEVRSCSVRSPPSSNGYLSRHSPQRRSCSVPIPLSLSLSLFERVHFISVLNNVKLLIFSTFTRHKQNINTAARQVAWGMGHATAQQRILGGFSANLRQQTLLALWAELSKNLETSSATGEIILKLSFSLHSPSHSPLPASSSNPPSCSSCSVSCLLYCCCHCCWH